MTDETDDAKLKRQKKRRLQPPVEKATVAKKKHGARGLHPPRQSTIDKVRPEHVKGAMTPGALNVKVTRQQHRFMWRFLEHGDVAKAYIDTFAPEMTDKKLAERNGRRFLVSPAARAIMAHARQRAEQETARAVARRLEKEREMAREERIKHLTPEEKQAIRDADPVAFTARTRAVAYYAISKAALAERLMQLATINIRDLVTWGPKGAVVKDSEVLSDAQAYGIVEVEQKMLKDGSITVRIKIGDRRQAIVDLAKLMGMMDTEPPPPPAEGEAKAKQAREQIMQLLQEMAQPKPLTINARAQEAVEVKPGEPTWE
jgi:transcription antitermination factor NusG